MVSEKKKNNIYLFYLIRKISGISESFKNESVHN